MENAFAWGIMITQTVNASIASTGTRVDIAMKTGLSFHVGVYPPLAQGLCMEDRPNAAENKAFAGNMQGVFFDVFSVQWSRRILPIVGGRCSWWRYCTDEAA